MFFAYLHILKLRNNILCCLVQILCTLLSDGFSKCAYCKIIKELLHTRETNVISRLRKTRPPISRQLWLYFNFSFAINEGDKISKMCWQINLQNLCVHVSNNLSEICFVYNQNMIWMNKSVDRILPLSIWFGFYILCSHIEILHLKGDWFRLC